MYLGFSCTASIIPGDVVASFSMCTCLTAASEAHLDSSLEDEQQRIT